MSDESKYRFDGEYRTLPECMDRIYNLAERFTDPAFKQNYIDTLAQALTSTMQSEERQKAHERRKDNRSHIMQTVVAPIIGLFGLMTMVSLVLYNPFPSKFQSGTLWIALSLFAAAFAAMIPGFFKLKHLKAYQAGGAIAVFIFIYTSTPKVMASNDFKPFNKLNFYVARKDTAEVESVSVDFDPNTSQPFCAFASDQINNYYGSNRNLPDTFTYFRKSDGFMYSSQTCQDIKEKDIVAISNSILLFFGDKRDAYLHFRKKLSQ